MAQFLVKKLDALDVVINDLGITIQGAINATYDLSGEQPNDVANSQDIKDAITGGRLIVLDPRDNTTEVTPIAESIKVIDNHNTAHYGVVGGRFGTLDDPATTPDTDTYLGFNGTEYVEVTATDIIDGDEGTQVTQDLIGATVKGGTDATEVYTPESVPGAGDATLVINVDDVFLRSDGNDNITTGNTITVDSGGTIAIATGGSLTIADAPQNATDAVNKAYADSLAAGLDPKESVRASTTTALIIGVGPTEWTYVIDGTIGDGSQDTLTAITAATTTIDGVLLEDGDRVLIKDQVDATQNGIYVATDTAIGTATVFTRAPDQDGSPANEVSAGNFTFVEQGTVYANSGWVLQGDGTLTLNTDDLDWVQFSAAGTYSAGIGLALNGVEFSLDINNLTDTPLAATDSIAFYDADGSVTANKRTLTDVFTDLDIPNGITADGFVVNNSGTWESRAITVAGTGNEDGLAITNGDGVAGNPVIGLDINGMTAVTLDGPDTVDVLDRVPVYNQSTGNNVFYTVGELAGAASASDSFKTWAVGTNATGTSVVALSSADTVTLNGGAGVTAALDGTLKTVTYSLAQTGLNDTAVTGADTIPFFDNDNSDTPEYRSFTNVFSDLDVVSGITSNGILVRTAEDTYASRTITASVTAAQEGAVITNGNGVAGNPTVGVDINGLTDSANDMASGDEFIAYDSANNVSMSGQQVADGTATLLGLGGLTVSTINTQQVLTLVDTTRANKVLSVDSVEIMFGENRLNNLDWMDIGNAVDADSSYIAPMDGTIVYATAHCEDTGSATMDLHVFVGTTDEGAVGSLLTTTQNASFSDNTININFNKGDRIRIQAQRSAGIGRIQDTVASLYIKWRG